MNGGLGKFASVKWTLTMYAVTWAGILAALEKDVPEGTLVAAIGAFNAANWLITSVFAKNGESNG